MRFVQNRIIALFFPALLITIIFTNSDTVNVSSNVPGVISSDTVWTKAGSPYELLGSVLVSKGVVLTIEPGVVVNFNDHQLDVNGTLIAKGTESNLIQFNGGRVNFLANSNEWNEQTGAGCIIEYANLSDTSVTADGAPKISKCSVLGINVNGQASISGNTIFQFLHIDGSAVIKNNTITNSRPESVRVTGGSPLISHNEITCRLSVRWGSPVISHNTLGDGIYLYYSNGPTEIVGNFINSASYSDHVPDFIVNNPDYKTVHVDGASDVALSGNTITGNGNQIGILFETNGVYSLADNTILNCKTAVKATFNGNLTIEKNAIINNQNGVRIQFVESLFGVTLNVSPVTVRYNTITNNQQTALYVSHNGTTITNNIIANNNIGIEVVDARLITQNNIYDNQYNLKVSTTDNINATNNYWGTTDTQTINQTILDQKYDYTKGTANFVPFLTEPNTQIPEFPTYLILPLVITTTLVTIICKKRMNNLTG